MTPKIPREFILGGHKISVCVEDSVVHEKSGEWDAATNVITLWTLGSHDDVILQTFFHELCHAIESIFGTHKKEEKRVDLMGQGLMQFSKTAKYHK